VFLIVSIPFMMKDPNQSQPITISNTETKCSSQRITISNTEASARVSTLGSEIQDRALESVHYHLEYITDRSSQPITISNTGPNCSSQPITISNIAPSVRVSPLLSQIQDPSARVSPLPSQIQDWALDAERSSQPITISNTGFKCSSQLIAISNTGSKCSSQPITISNTGLGSRVSQLTISNTGLKCSSQPITISNTGSKCSSQPITISNTGLGSGVSQLTISNKGLKCSSQPITISNTGPKCSSQPITISNTGPSCSSQPITISNIVPSVRVSPLLSQVQDSSARVSPSPSQIQDPSARVSPLPSQIQDWALETERSSQPIFHVKYTTQGRESAHYHLKCRTERSSQPITISNTGLSARVSQFSMSNTRLKGASKPITMSNTGLALESANQPSQIQDSSARVSPLRSRIQDRAIESPHYHVKYRTERSSQPITISNTGLTLESPNQPSQIQDSSARVSPLRSRIQDRAIESPHYHVKYRTERSSQPITISNTGLALESANQPSQIQDSSARVSPLRSRIQDRAIESPHYHVKYRTERSSQPITISNTGLALESPNQPSQIQDSSARVSPLRSQIQDRAIESPHYHVKYRTERSSQPITISNTGLALESANQPSQIQDSSARVSPLRSQIQDRAIESPHYHVKYRTERSSQPITISNTRLALESANQPSQIQDSSARVSSLRSQIQDRAIESHHYHVKYRTERSSQPITIPNTGLALESANQPSQIQDSRLALESANQPSQIQDSSARVSPLRSQIQDRAIESPHYHVKYRTERSSQPITISNTGLALESANQSSQIQDSSARVSPLRSQIQDRAIESPHYHFKYRSERSSQLIFHVKYRTQGLKSADYHLKYRTERSSQSS
ncbi:hypothetical protein WA026_004866, partial [Henosepilachna vigintioctopunctata]